MRHVYTLFAFLTLSAGLLQSAYAQTPGGPGGGQAPQGRITGSVVDAVQEDAIPSASVAVFSIRDSSLVTGAMSNLEGHFVIEGVRPGQYYVRISVVGYQIQNIPDVTIRPNALVADLGEVKLSADTEMLSEVEVTGERAAVEMQIDRTVYNTKDQIASSGGNATDVLRNIPSIEVDADNKVSLRGNQNVAVLINGRPAPVSGDALASFLQGMPASNIDRVEIMPNPSARYDPDGMAGIINIVLKENTQRGLNGSVTLAAATHGNYNGSGNLNYQRGKLNLFGTYGFRYGSRDSWGDNYRERYSADAARDPLSIIDQAGDDDFSNYSHMFNGTADYSLSQKNTLSYSTMFSVRPGVGSSQVLYIEMDGLSAPIQNTDRLSEADFSGSNMEHKLSFRRIVEASRNELTAEVRYARNMNTNTADFTEEITRFQNGSDLFSQVLEANETDATTNEGYLQLDYVRPWSPKGRIEAGYKSTLRLLDNTFFAAVDSADGRGFVPDLGRNNAFQYDEQVHAAYAQVQRSLGRIDVQAGLRAEQALTDFDLENDSRSAYDNEYFSLFPSAFFTYKPSDTRQVKLSYSKRINRPQTWALNPFQVRQDKYSVFIGNPDLKPEYVHSIEFGLTQFGKGYSLTATPFFRRTINEVTRWPELDETGEITGDRTGNSYVVTFENFDASNSYGFEVIGTVQIPKRFNAFVSFNGYRAVTSGNSIETNLSHSAFGWNTRANATYNVTSDLDLQATFFYRAPMDIPYGRIEAFTMTDIAIRHKLLNDKASIGLRVSDVFDSMAFRIHREDDTSLFEMDRNWTSRMAHLTFTYNFGQPQQGQNRRRGQNQPPPGQDMPDVGF